VLNIEANVKMLTDRLTDTINIYAKVAYAKSIRPKNDRLNKRGMKTTLLAYIAHTGLL